MADIGRGVVVAVVVALLLGGLGADSAGDPLHRPAQPMGLAYSDTSGAVGAYGRPGALVVAGSNNAGAPEFAEIAHRGAHVLLYLDPVIVNPIGRYQALLLEVSPCGPAVPHWGNLPRANAYGDLADFRPGSVLQGKLECVLETMVAENPSAAGWLADDVGSRSFFPGFDWANLSEQDRQAYREGAVALVRTFRSVADRHGLLVLVNGTWSGGDLDQAGGGYPDPGRDGNALADGGLVEHHDGQARFFGPYACSAQWAVASPVTRGIAVNAVLNRTAAGLAEYLATGCYAYAATQEDYDAVPPPWGLFTPTDLPTGSSR